MKHGLRSVLVLLLLAGCHSFRVLRPSTDKSAKSDRSRFPRCRASTRFASRSTCSSPISS